MLHGLNKGGTIGRLAKLSVRPSRCWSKYVKNIPILIDSGILRCHDRTRNTWTRMLVKSLELYKSNQATRKSYELAVILCVVERCRDEWKLQARACNSGLYYNQQLASSEHCASPNMRWYQADAAIAQWVPVINDGFYYAKCLNIATLY